MTHPELPCNLEAERAVLGAALSGPDALIRILAWMQSAWFYDSQHAALYDVMADEHRANGSINIRSLIVALQGRDLLEKFGGVEYLSNLTDCGFSWEIEVYAREVERCAVLRQLFNAGVQITRIGCNRDLSTDEALGSAQQQLARVAVRSSASGLVSFRVLADRQYERMNTGVVSGLLTGFRDLDDLTGGLHAGDLTILAARPSVGKTALLLSIAHRMSKLGAADCLIFSLEMTKDQLMERAAAMESRIDSHRLRMMHLNEEDADRFMGALLTLSELPIHIDDTPGASVAEIRAKAFRYQSESGRPLVLFVDYIQLMATPGFKPAERVAAVASISRDLKALAKELDCPVVALSQLSRALESRQSKIPMLSDLRESGGLEQDADNVLFIYRDELYDPESDRKGIAELHLAKARNGPIGVIPLRFDSCTTQFSDLTYRSPEGY